MENILSLAWFYCADRAWNPYRGDRSLRARLEAALEDWEARYQRERAALTADWPRLRP